VTTDEAGLPGTPDGFERLWTPHRMVYIDQNTAGGDRPCPFCAGPSADDETSLIVHRGAECFVVLNLFPYNPGHLLVCPYRHVADYAELTEQEVTELGTMTQQAMTTLRAVAGPQGFNVGMNMGIVGGAGIAAHLHVHVVPRWGGDTNFMPVIGMTRVLPQLLADTRDLLAAAWPSSPPTPA